MKIRDTIFMSVGGLLIITGMILGDILETNVQAQVDTNQILVYEYKSVFHSSSEITEKLNKYVEQGWILHETFKNEKVGSVEYVFHILKRVKK